MVPVWGWCWGKVRTADKSNEIAAIPELIDSLLLKGAIVTIDAMGCQRAIARKIVDAGAHYVLAIKANHKFPEIGKDHGRIETRHGIAFEWAALDEASPWPYARSAAIVEATREIGGATTTETRHYLSSLPASAARLAHTVRSHWAIENFSPNAMSRRPCMPLPRK